MNRDSRVARGECEEFKDFFQPFVIDPEPKVVVLSQYVCCGQFGALVQDDLPQPRKSGRRAALDELCETPHCARIRRRGRGKRNIVVLDLQSCGLLAEKLANIHHLVDGKRLVFIDDACIKIVDVHDGLLLAAVSGSLRANAEACGIGESVLVDFVADLGRHVEEGGHGGRVGRERGRMKCVRRSRVSGEQVGS